MMNHLRPPKNRLVRVPGVPIGILLFGLLTASAYGQSKPARATLDVDIRLQKAINLYAENGITVQYTHPKLMAECLYVGASYVSSRLGTAFNSNAIKQDNVLLTASYLFRPQWLIRPVVKLNVGYFRADYGSVLFDELPKTSLLVSPEIGLCYNPRFPLKLNASIGYNVITGNGLTGPGTLYPAFVQTSITWNILKKH